MTKWKNIITLEADEKYKHVYHAYLDLRQVEERFDRVHLSMFIYPYSRRVNANNFRIMPYEEYINDLASGRRTAYRLISRIEANSFGLILGVLIFLVFFHWKPVDLFSVQSVVSIGAAYVLGKEMWVDIDSWLINFTAGWRMKWKQWEYFYEQEVQGTIEEMWLRAREKRYETKFLIAEKMDFVGQSNSKLIEVGLPVSTGEKDRYHVLTLDFNQNCYPDVVRKGFMLGVKLGLEKNYGGLIVKREFFQGQDNGEVGAMVGGKWRKGACLVRTTLELYRLKIYLFEKMIEEKIVG